MKRAPLKPLLFSALLGALLANPVQAAEPPIPPEQLTCGSGDVLHFLAQALAQKNQLAPYLHFSFEQVEMVSESCSKGRVQLQCKTFLQLIDPEDLVVVDALNVAYELKEDSRSGMSLTFQPMR